MPPTALMQPPVDRRPIRIADPRVRTYTRPACEGDWPLIANLASRCSSRSLHARFGHDTLRERDWRELVTPASNLALLTTPHGRDDHVVALTSLGRTFNEPAVLSLGLLVADDWQCRGLGTALGQYAAWLGRHFGYATLSAYIAATNLPMRKVMASLGAPASPAASDHIDLRLSLDGTR